MKKNENVILTRDVRAMLVPSGDRITLKKGQQVTITQALGGSYTVLILGNMARIDGADADVLGMQADKPEIPTDDKPTEGPDLEAQVWDQLRACYDPEIPVNIVDLGLIYDLNIVPLGDGHGHRASIKMTLTAVGCGMGPVITEDARLKVLSMAGISEVDVELVWEPMWNQSMMSESARLQLGFM